jgi:hypothetical protein
MANRRFIDFPIAASVGNDDIVLIWQDGLNKQTTKATLFAGSPNSLSGLTDVDISALANGQILQYNSTTSKWENVDRTDIDLDQLGDVTIVSPTNGQVLVYNSSTSKWENSSAGFVPYTGAVTTVNLGAQSILAGSFVKDGGTSAQFLKADGSVDSNTYLTTGSAAATYVPYTGATADVNLGTHDLTAERGTFENNGSSNTLTVNHTSGSGYGIIVTKGGNNEALYVSKTSGSGNAMTVIGGRTSLVDLALSSVTNTAGDFLTLSGGVVHKRTAAEVRTDIGAGTVTSVAALTLGTSGTDLSSTVANGTTTPVITLNVPTASASNRGALSSADWSTFNSKQQALNGTGFVKASGTTISYDNTSYLPLTGGTLTGPLGGTSISLSGNLQLGTLTGGDSTATPNNINLNSTFSNTAGSNLKLILFNNTLSDIYGIGVSILQMDFSVPSGAKYRFYNGTFTINNLAGSGTRMVVADSNGLLSTQSIPLGTVTSVTASSPLFSSGGTTPNITIQQASGSQSGFLSSTDWTTFNNKQAAGNYVTTDTTQTITGLKTLSNSASVKLTLSGGSIQNGILYSAVSSAPQYYLGSGSSLFTGGDFGFIILDVDAGRGVLYDNKNTGELRFSAPTFQSFHVNSNSRMAIFNDGNVSISNSPSNAGFKLDVNGTGRFSGSTTFSITGTTNNILISQPTTAPTYGLISLNGITTEGSYIGIAGGGGTDKSLYLQSGNGGNLIFRTGNGSSFSTKLTIANTGAATFSASVATPHTTKSANYTLDASDYTVGFDCASNRTATLPDATTCAGRIYVIYQYNTNLGIRYVTLDGNGSQTINGITTYPLQYYGDFSSVMIQSTGSNWVVISDALYFIPV